MKIPTELQLTKTVYEFDGPWKVEQLFAWGPVFIRNRGRWVWMRRYTRVYRWSQAMGRYRTYDTVLGWKLAREASK